MFENNRNALETLAYVADIARYLAGSNRDQFVEDLLLAFYDKSINGIIPVQIKNPNANKHNINRLVRDRLGLPNLPPTGFSEQFVDTLAPKTDQTHHFAGFVTFGFYYGQMLGNVMATLYENMNGQRGNTGDILLGKAGVEAGFSLRSPDSEFWNNPGDWITSHLGGRK